MAETLPSAAGQPAPVPLPRDAPPPPGYVDPLEGSDVLDDLGALETDTESEPGPGTDQQHRTPPQ